MTPCMEQRREGLTLTLVIVVIASAISYVAGAMGLVPWVNAKIARTPVQSVQPQGSGAGTSSTGVDVKRLDEVMQAIQAQYVDEVTDEKLNEGALKGMFQALGDKYSTYFTAEEYDRFLEHFEGFTGIGVTVEVSERTGMVTVVAPIKGSPGEKAGLRAGDAILKVDGKEVTNLSLNEAVALIKGPKGTKVKLTVAREGSQDPLEFTITRDVITMPILDSKMVDKAEGIGYIQFYEFNKGSAKQVQTAINDLKGQGMKGLILDLRQNPGGLLDEARDAASLFIPPKSPVVHVVERGKDKRTLTTTLKRVWDGPLVVLVDGGSASAAEILSGAIKDLKVGTLMGVKTFGKGSVQTFWRLTDGSGIKLTTAKYLTAGEKAINGVGIDPDIVVENPNKVIPGEPGDPQLEAAVKQIKTGLNR